MTTSLSVRFTLAACAALGPAAAAQTESSTQAVFKQAAQQHAAGLKSDFADCAVALRADLALLVADLQEGAIQPPELPAGLADAMAQAFETARLSILDHVGQLDAVGSFLDAELVAADPDAGAPPGLVIGAGGALDDFHRKAQAALTSLDKAFAKELRRALLKARKLLPEGAVVTGHVFPLPLLQLADPGLDENAVETTFFPRVPLFLGGYGDQNERHFAVLGLSTGGQDIDLNVYDADGLLIGTLDSTPLFFGQIYRSAGPVPEGAQEPHGNLRVEMHAAGSGWTAGLGY